MTLRIAPIVGIFSIAGAAVILTGCEPLENALAVMNNGQPMPGGPSTPVASLHLSSAPPVVEQEVEVAAVEPCLVVPSHLFRTHWCNPDTLVLEPIP